MGYIFRVLYSKASSLFRLKVFKLVFILCFPILLWSKCFIPDYTYYLYFLQTLTCSCFLIFGSVNVTDDDKYGETLEALLVIESLGHAALVFVNKKPVGRNSLFANLLFTYCFSCRS